MILQKFLQILEHHDLYPLYQPIVDFHDARIVGYDTYLRGPADSILHTPKALYYCARQCNDLGRLDALSAGIMLEQFSRLNLSGLLFIKLSPLGLEQDGFILEKLLALSRETGLSRENLVIELSEPGLHESPHSFSLAVSACRRAGFRVALQLLLNLYENSLALGKLNPDYLKLKQDFVQELAVDQIKQGFVGNIQETSQQLNCRLIAEGVESRQDYLALRNLGVGLGQGYYFGRPRTMPVVSLDGDLFDNSTKTDRRSRTSEPIGNLSMAVVFVKPEERLEEVVKMFRRGPTLQSLAVVRDGQPVGMVHRQYLSDIFLQPFGRDLYGKKPIAQFMDAAPLIVEHDLPVEVVSQKLTERMKSHEFQDFIITRRGRYQGLGRVIEVLRLITDLQIRNASYANPLSGLPGNVPIEEEINRLLAREKPFVACYVDLDNFKPYNDGYGYNQGDEVLRVLAAILVEHADSEQDFVGHIGGDDFMILFQSEDWQNRCERIMDAFALKVPSFYSVQDQARGGIMGADRKGRETFFGLLSLSLGVARPTRCQSHHCVAALASEAKKQAKKCKGNALFVERRQGEH